MDLYVLLLLLVFASSMGMTSTITIRVDPINGVDSVDCGINETTTACASVKGALSHNQVKQNTVASFLLLLLPSS